MASSVYIVDAAFRRTQIKVTPGKYMREVLEEVCAAKKLKPEEYMLKNQNNKAVDLSQPFRLSGLTAGAKLQLTQASRSQGVVSVALSLPESEGGTRLSDKFPSSTSIWLVLRKFEEGVAGAPAKKLNLTQRGIASSSLGAGRLHYEQPSVNVMGRTLESFTDCQKTLAQLGFNNGSVLLRLSYKDSGEPLEQAMQEITEYFKAADAPSAGAAATATQDSHGAHATAGSAMQSTPNASAENAAMPADGPAGPEPNDQDVEMTPAPPSQPEPLPEGSDVIASSSETQPQPSEPSSAPPSDGISVYRPPSSSTPAAALQPDDESAYEPTVDHAKSHQKALQGASQNKRLLSDKELEEQEAQRQAKLATVQKVDVRVRYPDQSIVEFVVYASETGAYLYAKVRQTLRFGDAPFELRYFGSKGNAAVPDDGAKRLVRDLAFRGKVLVTLVWGDKASMEARGAPPLKEDYASRAKELKVDLQQRQVEREREDGEGKSAAGSKAEGGKEKGKGGFFADKEAKMRRIMGIGRK